MLKKIIIKNFRSNIKNYLVFFVSETMAMALFFSLFALRECLLSGIRDEMVSYLLDYTHRASHNTGSCGTGGLCPSRYEFKIAGAVMLIITTLLMFFSMKYYMKSRVKGYSMFMTFGMRRRLLYLMVLSEYGIGWLCSVCMGLLLGKGLVIGCQEILKSVDVTYEISHSVHAKTYGFTLAASLAVMAVAYYGGSGGGAVCVCFPPVLPDGRGCAVCRHTVDGVGISDFGVWRELSAGCGEKKAGLLL